MLTVQMLQGAEEKRRLRKRQDSRNINPNRDSNKVRCWLNVIGDYKYVTSVGGANAAMGQLINIIQQVFLLLPRPASWPGRRQRVHYHLILILSLEGEKSGFPYTCFDV